MKEIVVYHHKKDTGDEGKIMTNNSRIKIPRIICKFYSICQVALPMQGPKRNQNCVFNEAYRVIEYIFVPRWFIFGIKKAENRSNDGYAL